MCTSQYYLSFAIVKVEEIIVKPIYYMLKSPDKMHSVSVMELLLIYRRVSST